jgi:hypothetical protein
MNKQGRPPVLTDEIKQVLGDLKAMYPTYSPRALEKQWNYFVLYVKDKYSHLKDKGPGKSKINDWVNTCWKPNKDQIGIEKVWNTAALKDEPISHESIPWLIGLQIQRGLYHSKPVTIRQAKWFDRLSGFRQYLESGDSLTSFTAKEYISNVSFFDIPWKVSLSTNGIPINERPIFIAQVIATWAQVYAYREYIDTMSGIKNPDYSDLDISIAKNEIGAIYAHNFQQYFTRMLDKTATQATYSEKQRLNMLHEVDHITFQETTLLGHALGDPEMKNSSIELYSYALWQILVRPKLIDRISKLAYIKKIQYLVHIREWVIEKPYLKYSAFPYGLDRFLKIAEKESETNIGAKIQDRKKS